MVENLPRRRFLKLAALLVGGALAAGAGAWSYLFGDDDSDDLRNTDFGPLLVFDQGRAATVFAFAETILPKGPQFPDARQAQVVQRLDEELYFVSAPIRADFNTVVDVLDLLPLLYGHFSTFTGLDPDGRRKFLEETKATRSDTVRIVAGSLRMAVMMMYYGHPSSWSAIGYDGPYEKSLRPAPSDERAYYAQRTRRTAK